MLLVILLSRVIVKNNLRGKSILLTILDIVQSIVLFIYIFYFYSPQTYHLQK